MRNKTSKLRKLERNRYSILTDNLEDCYLCGSQPVDIHEVFGGCNRKVSMAYGFCIPLCRMHHRLVTDDNQKNLMIKRWFQEAYEQEHSREEFMHLIGKNYL